MNGLLEHLELSTHSCVPYGKGGSYEFVFVVRCVGGCAVSASVRTRRNGGMVGCCL